MYRFRELICTRLAPDLSLVREIKRPLAEHDDGYIWTRFAADFVLAIETKRPPPDRVLPLPQTAHLVKGGGLFCTGKYLFPSDPP